MVAEYLSLWKYAFEILVMWVVFYWVVIFIKGTPAVQLGKGLLIVVVAFFITDRLALKAIHWILTYLFATSVVAFLIIFQPELRRALAHIGQSPFFRVLLKEEQIVDEIVEVVDFLSKKKIGAIIALERGVSLRPYTDNSIVLDAQISRELLINVFMPNTPLHDGGVVIEGTRVRAAGCVFPLTQNPSVSKTLGTRHRAALGLSEETDAVVAVVSEETGSVSIATDGELKIDIDRDTLAHVLRGMYKPKEIEKRYFFDFRKRGYFSRREDSTSNQ
jgi:diadenylate cyclase